MVGYTDSDPLVRSHFDLAESGTNYVGNIRRIGHSARQRAISTL
jgi:hypothetical protein